MKRSGLLTMTILFASLLLWFACTVAKEDTSTQTLAREAFYDQGKELWLIALSQMAFVYSQETGEVSFGSGELFESRYIIALDSFDNFPNVDLVINQASGTVGIHSQLTGSLIEELPADNASLLMCFIYTIFLCDYYLYPVSENSIVTPYASDPLRDLENTPYQGMKVVSHERYHVVVEDSEGQRLGSDVRAYGE